ncbi:DUF4386 domain-containing protein [Persicimonas caeni]|uniref:DUF4386 domain-containing protein n=1 Tax=Persicimonas caeni TaxID=2292766 RepID=A0A4Y6PQH3_PERCE|nr:DUF4386 domain-containing protein [Persicimonas caeni]QDG50592.1 DUF4386 domain-containing protein [Persicimonas caeni]QED31813.1 DUF4386 domain-containing protein [Persicimonas caeni]
MKDITPRVAALTAGLGMLLMAVIAPLCIFGVIEKMAVPGDASATAANLIESASLVRNAGVGLLAVVLLDVIVAWGLYVVLRPVNASLSLLGAWLRVTYSAIFAVAITNLFDATRAATVDPEQALFLLGGFDQAWQFALVVFGAHLVVVGYLAWRADYISRWLGALLVIAGVGYALDGVGTLIDPTYLLDVGRFTFVGEILFLFWLLIRGARKGMGFSTTPHSSEGCFRAN